MRQQFTLITPQAARRLALCTLLCVLGSSVLSGCGAEGSSSSASGLSDNVERAEASDAAALTASSSDKEVSSGGQPSSPASAEEAPSQEVSPNIPSAEAPQDSIFISDEVYMEVSERLGDSYAQQLRTFAENYLQWLPEDWELAPGTINFAVCDLDEDSTLELLRSQIQGTGLYAFNACYRADAENGQVSELEQQTDEDGFEPEIALSAPDRLSGVYRDSDGRLLYLASDYGRAGTQFSSCTDGCFYLENDAMVSLSFRSRTAEADAKEEWTYTYYLPGQEAPVPEAEWEAALSTFLSDKIPVEASVCWKSLYVDEVAAKKVQGWFLLLAESLEESLTGIVTEN